MEVVWQPEAKNLAMGTNTTLRNWEQYFFGKGRIQNSSYKKSKKQMKKKHLSSKQKKTPFPQNKFNLQRAEEQKELSRNNGAQRENILISKYREN